MKLNLEKINAWFEKRAWGIIRFRWLFLGLFFVTFLLGMYGASLMKVDVSNESMFLNDDPMKIATDKFKEMFGNDQFVGILIESDELFSKEKLILIRELGQEILDSVPFADQIVSLTDIEFSVGTEYGMSIEQIVPEIIPSSPEELDEIKDKVFSKKIFREKLISSDGTQSWIMVKLLPFPKDWEKNYEEYPQLLVGKKISQIIEKEKYKDFSPNATGNPYISYQKKLFFDAERGKVRRLALLFALIILAVSLRSWKGVAIPIITAISSVTIVNGAIGFLGIAVDNMVMTFSVLIGLCVALAYSIHLFSFYKRNFRKTGKRKQASAKAIGEMGWPVFFTALTTVTALLSFIFVPIKTVRFIGLCTAAVVGVTYFVVIVITPALLSFGKDRKPRPEKVGKTGTFTERIMGRLGNWVLKHPALILIVYSVASLVLIYGITKVEANVDPVKTIGLEVPYVKKAYEVASSELGTLDTYDVTIKLPKQGMAKEPEVLRNLDILAEEAKNYPHTKRVSSILDVVKDMNQVMNENNKVYYSVPDKREVIAQLMLLYENAGGSESENWVDYEYQTLRLMVMLDDFNSATAIQTYEQITARAGELFPGAEVSVVGTMPQYIVMIDYITKWQIISFLIALIVVTLMLMIVFGNVKSGLIGLIPNITPALVIGGIMGFMGIPLDTISVLIMPMILGLAVDDTIHFINHGKLEFQRTGNYHKSIVRTFRTVGVALLTTTIVLSTNFAVYMTSCVNTYFNMGLLAVAGIVSALLADYFVTPVLFKAFRIYGKEINEN